MTSSSSSLSETEQRWTKDAQIFEYGSAANPDMKPVPVVVHPPELHESGPTRVIPFDLSRHMDILDGDGGATSPNLMASFVRIVVGESVDTRANATSQAFYVIRGSGSTTSADHGTISWSAGDMFVVPVTNGPMTHTCVASELCGGAALYWIHDQPLMDYLGVSPSATKKFEPTLYKRQDMLDKVEEIRHDDKNRSNNRMGVLLGNAKCAQTKTLTHVLWSLLNSIPANSVQRPHRHNSVALDLCVEARAGVYTLMGREIDDKGFIIDPIRCDWAPGGVFVTPPGWWHSHHNESGESAWVLPIQDAGLFTHQRTLDIRFVDDELALHHSGRIRGSAFAVTDHQFTQMKELSAKATAMQATYETEIVANTLFEEDEGSEGEAANSEEEEEKKDDEDKFTFVPLKRSSTIQVGALRREEEGKSGSIPNIPKPSVGLHKRCKSIQVGSDLASLKITMSPSRVHY